MKWFRFYHDALDDPKVQMLPPELFKTWVNLLCIASRETLRGTLPETSVLAFQLRMSNAEVTKAVSDLQQAGLVDEREDGRIQPHNWEGRQPESDDVAQRVAAHRAKQSSQGNVTRNVTSKVTVTPPEVEAEEEADTDTDISTTTAREAKKTADVIIQAPFVDLDINRVVSQVQRSFEVCPHFPARDGPFVAEKFVRWQGYAKKPPKDWYSAWLNWLKKEVNSDRTQKNGRAYAHSGSQAGLYGTGHDDAEHGSYVRERIDDE